MIIFGHYKPPFSTPFNLLHRKRAGGVSLLFGLAKPFYAVKAIWLITIVNIAASERLLIVWAATETYMLRHGGLV